MSESFRLRCKVLFGDRDLLGPAFSGKARSDRDALIGMELEFSWSGNCSTLALPYRVIIAAHRLIEVGSHFRGRVVILSYTFVDLATSTGSFLATGRYCGSFMSNDEL
jgi:hypothetical protein